MKTVLKLSLVALLSVFALNTKAQTNQPEELRHDIRISYSDALPLQIAHSLGERFLDAFSFFDRGSSRVKSAGMFNVAYRYRLTNRLSVGGSIGYSRSKVNVFKQTTLSERRTINDFIVMPELEYSYVKTGIIDFYGSTAAGIMVSREKSSLQSKKLTNTGFVYQFSPVGIRVGHRLAAFAELGIGIKGYVNAGISYKF